MLLFSCPRSRDVRDVRLEGHVRLHDAAEALPADVTWAAGHWLGSRPAELWGQRRRINYSFLELNNFCKFGNFWKCGTRFAKISSTLDTFLHFLRGVAKFRQNFINIERKNGKFAEKILENAKF